MNVDKLANSVIEKVIHSFEREKLSVSKQEWDKLEEGFLEKVLLQGEEGDGTDAAIRLGSYKPLPLKGELKIYIHNIASFFWGIIKSIHEKHEISSEDLTQLAKAAVAKTYYHEIFHYRCDISSVLFGTRPNRLLEEALAVVYGHRHAKLILSPDGQELPANSLFNVFLDKAFRYTAPGYKDWTKYAKIDDFRNELSRHLIHGSALRLLNSAGGELDGWFAGSLFLFVSDFPLDMMDEVEC